MEMVAEKIKYEKSTAGEVLITEAHQGLKQLMLSEKLFKTSENRLQGSL
jgi:hypothetical protein